MAKDYAEKITQSEINTLRKMVKPKVLESISTVSSFNEPNTSIHTEGDADGDESFEDDDEEDDDYDYEYDSDELEEYSPTVTAQKTNATSLIATNSSASLPQLPLSSPLSNRSSTDRSKGGSSLKIATNSSSFSLPSPPMTPRTQKIFNEPPPSPPPSPPQSPPPSPPQSPPPSPPLSPPLSPKHLLGVPPSPPISPRTPPLKYKSNHSLPPLSPFVGESRDGDDDHDDDNEMNDYEYYLRFSEENQQSQNTSYEVIEVANDDDDDDVRDRYSYYYDYEDDLESPSSLPPLPPLPPDNNDNEDNNKDNNKDRNENNKDKEENKEKTKEENNNDNNNEGETKLRPNLIKKQLSASKKFSVSFKLNEESDLAKASHIQVDDRIQPIARNQRAGSFQDLKKFSLVHTQSSDDSFSTQPRNNNNDNNNNGEESGLKNSKLNTVELRKRLTTSNSFTVKRYSLSFQDKTTLAAIADLANNPKQKAPTYISIKPPVKEYRMENDVIDHDDYNADDSDVKLRKRRRNNSRSKSSAHLNNKRMSLSMTNISEYDEKDNKNNNNNGDKKGNNNNSNNNNENENNSNNNKKKVPKLNMENAMGAKVRRIKIESSREREKGYIRNAKGNINLFNDNDNDNNIINNNTNNNQPRVMKFTRSNSVNCFLALQQSS